MIFEILRQHSLEILNSLDTELKKKLLHFSMIQ